MRQVIFMKEEQMFILKNGITSKKLVYLNIYAYFLEK